MEPFTVAPPPSNVRQVAATLYGPAGRTLPLADVFDPAAVHVLAAAPAALAACRQALALIRDHWPIDHGRADVGTTWAALVHAIDAAHPPLTVGAPVLYRPGDGDDPMPGIVQRAYRNADTGDRDYTVFLCGRGYTVSALPWELTARAAA